MIQTAEVGLVRFWPIPTDVSAHELASLFVSAADALACISNWLPVMVKVPLAEPLMAPTASIF